MMGKNFVVTEQVLEQMVYGLRDEIFFRLNYHIVLCIDLFVTSHEEGNFWQICRLFGLKYFGMLNEILILFI